MYCNTSQHQHNVYFSSNNHKAPLFDLSIFCMRTSSVEILSTQVISYIDKMLDRISELTFRLQSVEFMIVFWKFHIGAISLICKHASEIGTDKF